MFLKLFYLLNETVLFLFNVLSLTYELIQDRRVARKVNHLVLVPCFMDKLFDGGLAFLGALAIVASRGTLLQTFEALIVGHIDPIAFDQARLAVIFGEHAGSSLRHIYSALAYLTRHGSLIDQEGVSVPLLSFLLIEKVYFEVVLFA